MPEIQWRAVTSEEYYAANFEKVGHRYTRPAGPTSGGIFELEKVPVALPTEPFSMVYPPKTEEWNGYVPYILVQDGTWHVMDSTGNVYEVDTNEVQDYLNDDGWLIRVGIEGSN